MPWKQERVDIFECSGTIQRPTLSCLRVPSPGPGLPTPPDEPSTLPNSSQTLSPPHTGHLMVLPLSGQVRSLFLLPGIILVLTIFFEQRCGCPTCLNNCSARAQLARRPPSSLWVKTAGRILKKRRRKVWQAVGNAGKAKHLQWGESHQPSKLWQGSGGEPGSAGTAGPTDQC